MNRAQRYFANIVELARDRGLIGKVLRNYDEWIWQAADKSAEQDAEYQRKHHDPDRLPLPDPWRFLLGMRDVPACDNAVFRAARSQLVALRHLVRMRMGIASLNEDWQQEATQAGIAGDMERSNHAARRVANALWQFEPFVKDLHYLTKENPGLSESANVWREQRRKQLVHRGERPNLQKSKPRLPYSEFRDQNKLPVLLVEWWVRQGVNGAPGFMFWRNEALTEYLYFCSGGKKSRFAENRDRRCYYVKYVRQRLKLIPVGDATNFVWDLCIKTQSDGDFEICGFQRNGEKAFNGTIPAKHFPPLRLPALTTCYAS